MYRIVYMSQTPQRLSDADLDAILADTATHAEEADLGGLLIYARNTFFQVIEGKRRQVEAVFNRVFMDPRHQRVRVFQQRAIAGRRFEGFAMGFRRRGGGPAPDGFFELSRTALKERIPQDAAEDLRNLIRGYGDVKVRTA